LREIPVMCCMVKNTENCFFVQLFSIFVYCEEKVFFTV
jgi:hypothetical protein